jgi:hypothetical protein
MGKEAVEGKDGYMILTLPETRPVGVAALRQEAQAGGAEILASSNGSSLDPERRGDRHGDHDSGPARYVSMEFECCTDGRA